MITTKKMGNNTSSYDDDAGLKIFFETHQFYYRGNQDMPICNKCYYCGKNRFTQQEVALLSSPALTMNEFMTLDVGYIRVMNCNDCLVKDRTPFARISYNMKEIWMLEESANLFTKFPKKMR